MLNRDSFKVTSFDETSVRFNDAPVAPGGGATNGGVKVEPKPKDKKKPKATPAVVRRA